MILNKYFVVQVLKDMPGTSLMMETHSVHILMADDVEQARRIANEAFKGYDRLKVGDIKELDWCKIL